MSKNLKIVIMLCFVFVIFSCSVEDTVDNTETNQAQNMNELDVPDGFDWNFSEQVEVLLSAQDAGGNPVPGYRVSLYNSSNQLVFSQNTDVNGEINTEITVPEFSNTVTLKYGNMESSVAIVGSSVHHQMTVEPLRGGTRIESVEYYPAEDEVSTVMFEDKWPQVHDYDFNDMVVELSSSKYWHDDGMGGTEYLDSLVIYVKAIASGASYKNGFSIAYPCDEDIIATSTLTYSVLDTTGSYVPQLYSETTSEYYLADGMVVFNFFDDAYGVLDHTPDNVCINTVPTDNWHEPVSLKLLFEFTPDTYEKTVIAQNQLNPYLRVDAQYGYEIHLPGMDVTGSFNQSALFSTGDDNGDYSTENNYSWGLLFVGQIEYPTEFTDIVTAYPQLADYFAESGGADWYDHPVANGIADGKVYDRPDMD